MIGEVCDDNRFEIIKKAKKDIIENTNIESSPDEMNVLDNILFRVWQMGWLKTYEQSIDDTNKKDEEMSEYSHYKTTYICGNKPHWNVGDVLAFYKFCSNKEGEVLLGEVTDVKFDEELCDWNYTFKDGNQFYEETLLIEKTYKKRIMKFIKSESYPINDNSFEYFGKKYNCQYAIERDTKLILQEAEQTHKDTFEKLYDKESLKPNKVKLYVDKDDNPLYGMIVYTISYKNSNSTRLACGDYYPIFELLALEPHPFQGQICW